MQFPRCSNLMLNEELYLCRDILHITPWRVCVFACCFANRCKEMRASLLIDLQKGGFPSSWLILSTSSWYPQALVDMMITIDITSFYRRQSAIYETCGVC
mmetsp:Transcript_34024/g.69415  ORF Transcript_34024/g.69415 Transcript_34024/m.69415 type:complete len:100 (+) Transcript_34024:876-1175(+)